MAKRRIILNEDQLPDFGGGSGGSGESIIFKQKPFTNSNNYYSKELGTLTNIDTFVSAFSSDTNLFIGSRSFDVDAECAASSIYEGKIFYTGRVTGYTGVIRLQLSIGAGIASQPLGMGLGNSLEFYPYTFDCSFFIEFYKNNLNQNKIVLYANILRTNYDDTEDAGAQNKRITINSAHFDSSISGNQDFDIGISGVGLENVFIHSIFCKKLPLIENTSVELSNSYKWKQTSTISGILNMPLLVPDSGSLTFTPSEMSEGKKYRVLIKHTTDDPLTGNVNFNIKIGGNSFFGITGLTTGNGESNQLDFILEFKTSASEVYMYLNGINDGTILNSLLFATINPLINQSIEVIANTALLSQSIIYSTCEIL